MSRESSLLPSGDAREAALFFVVSALCFLAALAALSARGTYTAAQAWTVQVEGELTVRVRDTDGRGAEDAAEKISGIAGIESATVVSKEELEELLAPSFGAGELPESLPMPHLIAVHASPGTADLVTTIPAVLSEAGYVATVDAHDEWASDVRRALGTLRFSALGMVALLAATAIAVIAFATHAALLARRDIVDVLHLSGAEDRFIAKLFERRFWALGLKAGASGAVSALLVTALIIFSAQSAGARSELLPQLTLDFWDLMILITAPLAAGIAARFAARALKAVL